MQIASRRFAGGKNKREIKRASWRKERKRAKPAVLRGCSMTGRGRDQGNAGGEGNIKVEWSEKRGGEGGRTRWSKVDAKSR